MCFGAVQDDTKCATAVAGDLHGPILQFWATGARLVTRSKRNKSQEDFPLGDRKGPPSLSHVSSRDLASEDPGRNSIGEGPTRFLRRK